MLGHASGPSENRTTEIPLDRFDFLRKKPDEFAVDNVCVVFLGIGGQIVQTNISGAAPLAV